MLQVVAKIEARFTAVVDICSHFCAISLSKPRKLPIREQNGKRFGRSKFCAFENQPYICASLPAS